MTVTPMRERLERIHDELWRQGKPFIRNYEGVNVNILEDALTRLAQHPVVFIREEYARIWEHIVSLRNEAVATGRTSQDGLVVTGHPGIGKSLFLFYALGAALEAHIPVVLCRHTHFCAIFDATGVKVSGFSRDLGFDVPCHALYLVDCNFDLRSLPSLILGRSGVLVHVVAPRYRTAWEWAERSERALFWIMDVWTRAEMQALQRTTEALGYPEWMARAPPGKAVYTPLEVFDTLGPSAGQCVHMAGVAKSPARPKVDLAGYNHTVLAASFSPRLDAILDMVRRRAPSPDFYEDEDLEHLLFLYNAAPHNPSRRPEFRYAIPTRFLHELVADHLRRVTFRTRLDQLCSAAALVGVPLTADFLREARTRLGRVYVYRIADDEASAFRLGLRLALPDDPEFDPEAPSGDIADDVTTASSS